MKLSTLSHPICDSIQIVVYPDIEKNIDKVSEKIYKHFEKDDMIYYLKIFNSDSENSIGM